jgi:hypothetical protein
MLQSGSVQHKTTEALVRPARAAGLHAQITITAKSKENICHVLSEGERRRMGRGAGGGGSAGHPERQLRNFQMFRDIVHPQDKSSGHPSTTHTRPKDHT